MKYDFTSIMDRHGKDAIAVDVPISALLGGAPRKGFSTIPMWVADMNFPTVPTIPEAIIERAKHPAYGYFTPTDEYYDTIIRWHEKRNGVTGLYKECIGYENGVIGGVISALNVFCSKGDKVLVHSPTYIGFTMGLENNGYKIVHSPLKQDEAGVWRMDYEDMDFKLKTEKIHAAIFCSPHNPCGRVWERWEIEKAMELYRENNVMVVSDEIWSDLTLAGYRHIPTQSVSEDAKMRTVALYAPSKTFNLAGLVGSYHIIYNSQIRDRVEKEASLSHYNDMNMLSMHALIGAYKPEGYEWVDELRQVLSENVDYACDYITSHFEGVAVSKPQGTYMLFLDCTKWCADHGKTVDDLQRMGAEVGVAWQDGRAFHGPCHIRMNLALPLSLVKEAFDRLDKYVFNGPEEVPGQRLEVGKPIPDFTFDTPFETGRTLAQTAGRVAGKTALVFLRYYGCTLCQYDIHQFAVQYDKITAAGGQLLVVLQSEPALIAGQLKPGDLPFDIICDPDQDLYRRFAIAPAASMAKMADLNTVRKIGAAAMGGFRHGAFEGNELQLPAAFVVDRDLNVCFAHYGAAIGDVPGPEELAGYLA